MQLPSLVAAIHCSTENCDLRQWFEEFKGRCSREIMGSAWIVPVADFLALVR